MKSWKTSLRAVLLIAQVSLPLVFGFSQNQKVALVVGIRSYQKVAPLQNSLNDAHDMAAELKIKGFQVIELYIKYNSG